MINNLPHCDSARRTSSSCSLSEKENINRCNIKNEQRLTWGTNDEHLCPLCPCLFSLSYRHPSLPTFMPLSGDGLPIPVPVSSPLSHPCPRPIAVVPWLSPSHPRPCPMPVPVPSPSLSHACPCVITRYLALPSPSSSRLKGGRKDGKEGDSGHVLTRPESLVFSLDV
jgi:hypothetical protein